MRNNKLFHEIFRFCVTGFLAFIVDYLILILFKEVFNFEYPYPHNAIEVIIKIINVKYFNIFFIMISPKVITTFIMKKIKIIMCIIIIYDILLF